MMVQAKTALGSVRAVSVAVAALCVLSLTNGGDGGTIEVLQLDPAQSETDSRPRVLLYGDSLIEGSVSWPGLGSVPAAMAFSFSLAESPVEFVGPRSGVRSGSSGLLASIPHDGVTGRAANEVLDSPPLVRAFQQEISDAEPATVVLVLGINDLLDGATAEEVEASLTELVELALAAGAEQVFVVPPPPIFRAADEAASLEAALIDKFNDETGRVSVLETSSILETGDLFDGVHPDQGGQVRLARGIVGMFVAS